MGLDLETPSILCQKIVNHSRLIVSWVATSISEEASRNLLFVIDNCSAFP